MRASGLETGVFIAKCTDRAKAHAVVQNMIHSSRLMPGNAPADSFEIQRPLLLQQA
jgi:hypothetical protein